MPRHARATAAQGAQARAGKARTDGSASPGPFSALSSLRRDAARSSTCPDIDPGAPRSGPIAGAKAPPPKEAAQASSAAVSADDAALFRKSNADVRPLRDSGRAELEHIRPPPEPRPRTTAETGHEPALRRKPTDPLRAAYEDVTPLRDSGRVELYTPALHRARLRGAEPSFGGTSMSAIDPGALPSDIDPTDSGALFRHAMRGAQPIDTRNRAELVRPGPAPAPIKREADERAALDESLLAPLSFEDRLDMGDEAAFLRTGLPRRVLSDLRRGRWVLQGQIDLHGLTRDEARDALGHFLTASLQLGRRCIRVIHGKGLGSPGKVSILKQLSRGWLAQREEILAFCQAGPHDGGSGALLVLMRAQNVSRD